MTTLRQQSEGREQTKEGPHYYISGSTTIVYISLSAGAQIEQQIVQSALEVNPAGVFPCH